ncbi:MAG: hypothetical protein NZ699_13640 [Roseiflexus sp.]|nr:hypothetical protein [Roseiflexus sp.]MCS7290167.1 hypothetical protein [Roseiflexus sp.]MDW8148777.1 hypothetical protein [Roseiflexaceae bacterium]MDW8232610.1 hypothetical protein [Roseiflexaceae bacterium]
MSKQNRHAILEPVRFLQGGGNIEPALSILQRNCYAAIPVLPDMRAGVVAVAASLLRIVADSFWRSAHRRSANER